MSTQMSTAWSLNGAQALVLENDRLRVIVLPELGGKIWQVTHLRSGRNLLWHNPRLTARPVPFGSNYDDLFFGGWDELFPNDLAEEIGGEPYPDHGELWAASWSWRIEVDSPERVRVALTMATAISACQIVKTVELVAGESIVRLSWRIENGSRRDLPYLWKQHVAVPADEPAVLSMGARSMYVEDFGNPRAGGTGSQYAWPHLTDDVGQIHDMRQTLPADSGVAEFQYATELDDGWCAVTYADGFGIGLAFDRDVFRSCWTFASYGGWRAHQVLVLEPCTGYPVSVNDGIASGTHQVLPAGGVLETELLMVAYDGMAEVTGIDHDGSLRGTRLDSGGGA